MGLTWSMIEANLPSILKIIRPASGQILKLVVQCSPGSFEIRHFLPPAKVVRTLLRPPLTCFFFALQNNMCGMKLSLNSCGLQFSPKISLTDYLTLTWISALVTASTLVSCLPRSMCSILLQPFRKHTFEWISNPLLFSLSPWLLIHARIFLFIIYVMSSSDQ